MRGKNFSNFKKARTCPSCSSVRVDEHNCGKFAREFKRLTHRVLSSTSCFIASTD